MNAWIAFYTLLRREVSRFIRIWPQTLLPPIITQSLYFLIFGTLIGSQVRAIDGIPYIAFIVPGLVMMGVINSAFSNVVSSFFGAKFQRNLEEMLVSPMSPGIMIAGFISGGALRGLLVGLIVYGVAAFFTTPTVFSFPLMVLFIVLTAVVFALGGLVNGIFARKFDDIGLFTTFILTPLTYLGGVFYSIKDLPPIWQFVSRFNPILYMIDGFRYSFYGRSDVDVFWSAGMLLTTSIVLAIICYYLIRKGVGLRT